jgi:hypothetical protein
MNIMFNRIPNFNAEASLYEMGKHYRLHETFRAVAGTQKVIPAQLDLICDWFPWFPGCPKPPGGVSCWHTTTDTFCAGFSMWCKDNSRCSDGSTRSSGWYPCGLCFGFG